MSDNSKPGHRGRLVRWAVSLASGGCFVAGWLADSPLLLAGGAACLCGLVVIWHGVPVVRRVLRTPEPLLPEEGGNSTAELVEELIDLSRYALLLRPQLAPGLDDEQMEQTLEALEEEMSLVPAGQVVIGLCDEAMEDGKIDAADVQRYKARLAEVEPLFLDRQTVTNREFYEFVAAGGYEQIAIWDEDVWPAVLDFVDSTGQPGPQFWKNGRFRTGAENEPVVGVSWYEASAYARWAGKRLPSDAEWVKSGSWPVSPEAGVWLQRKYPWGNAFDHDRANVWGSGPRRPVAVDQYPEGLSVGGVSQLVGNVWEWTADNFGRRSDTSLSLPVPMKSVRGGAYDTYFERQASCQYQSGDNPLARKHNIGFRLALGVCDLAPVVVERLQLGSRKVDTESIDETAQEEISA